MRCQPLIVFSLIAALLLSLTASDPATNSSIESIGCYSTADEKIKGVLERMFLYNLESNAMTPRLCGQFCLSKGLQFPALSKAYCTCGASMDGMRRAENGSLTDMCSEACAGDSSQRCGGSDAISVYQSTPAELTPLPSRCDGGKWTVRLNRSADFQPSLERINSTDMILVVALPFIDSPAGLESCMRKCEGFSTCWSVIVGADEYPPKKWFHCVLLDQNATKAIAKLRPRESNYNHALFSLAEWTCDSGSSAVGGSAAWLTVMMAAAACRQSLTNLGP